MKVHWFSILSIAGVILLASNTFGNEVRWKKPGSSEPGSPSIVQSAITHIPAIGAANAMSFDYHDELALPDIVQVQYVEMVQFSDGPSEPIVQTLPSLPRGIQVPRQTAEKVPCGNQMVFKSIREISHDIRPTFPEELPEECYIESKPFYGRHFSRTNYMWTASALSTKAAYFEDTQLERHGHTKVRPVFQPLVSGARFFGTIPLLPYHMGVTPPGECVYTLGHQRAGTYTPYMAEPFPISPRGALFQAGALTGAVFAFP